MQEVSVNKVNNTLILPLSHTLPLSINILSELLYSTSVRNRHIRPDGIILLLAWPNATMPLYRDTDKVNKGRWTTV